MTDLYDPPTSDNGHVAKARKPRKPAGFDHAALDKLRAEQVAAADQEIARLEAEIRDRQALLRHVKATKKRWEDAKV